MNESRDVATQEMLRYRELLEPLEQMSPTGQSTLPGEEREVYELALSHLTSDVTDPIELEEAIAAFARAMWAAPGWAEPPARISRALVQRSRQWADPERADAAALAQRFADRATHIDPNDHQTRMAVAAAKLALGDLAQAERAASILPLRDGTALALRADIAEARGRLDDALRLRQEQLEHEQNRAEVRFARSRIANLHRQRNDLDGAIRILRDNMVEFPDWAPGRRDLAQLHQLRGNLLEAFAEYENAVLLGMEETREELDGVASELDRGALAEFRRMLRSGRDHDPVELCPPAQSSAAGAQL